MYTIHIFNNFLVKFQSLKLTLTDIINNLKDYKHMYNLFLV